MAASGAFGMGMGKRRIKEILNKYPNIHKQKLTTAELIQMIKSIPGFKDATATVFAEGLPRFKKFLMKMPGIKIKQVKKVKKLGSRLDGEYVVFTGFRSDDLKITIQEQGGKTGDSKSKMTVLVVKNLDSGTTKEQVAEEKGIPIYTVQQFKTKFRL